MSTLQRGAMLTAVAVALAGAVAGCHSGGGVGSGGSSTGFDSNATVATVNGTPISQADFYDQLQVYRPQSNPMTGMDSEPAGVAVLRSMIQRELLEQMAKKDGVYPTDTQINDDYNVQVFQAGRYSVKPIDQQLQQNGLTPDFVKSVNIIPQLCQINEMTKGITVTDSEVKAYYDLHKNDLFTDPDEVHFKRMVAATQADANTLAEDLQKGEPWSTVYNLPQSIDKTLPDGEYPQWFSLSMSNPQFKPLVDALKSTDAGKTAAPIKMQNQFWVIQVVEKRPKQTYPLDKVQGFIKEQLLQQKAQQDPSRFGQFQENLRNKATTADIQVNPPQYKPLVQQITNPAPPTTAPSMGTPTAAPPAGAKSGGPIVIKPGASAPGAKKP